MKRILVIILLSLSFYRSSSQIAIVSTGNGSIFYLNQNGSLCSFVSAGSFCNIIGGGYYLNFYIWGSALRGDTLYYTDWIGSLYKMKLGDISSCTQLTQFRPPNGAFSLVTALTIDKNGVLYATSSDYEVFSYNPYTRTKISYGYSTLARFGDLMFYKDKLLLASQDYGGIYELNLKDLSASTVFIYNDTLVFSGIISLPFSCNTNKYYAFGWPKNTTEPGTSIYELDMINKKVVGLVCKLPLNVFNGASSVEDGNTYGFSIDTVNVKPTCGDNTVADLQIVASSATPGPFTYTLDGSVNNTTGVFNSVAEGSHNIHIQNQRGCVKDSVFTVLHGLAPVVKLDVSKPANCSSFGGSIRVSASSGFNPLRYSINNGPYSNTPVFNNLATGSYTVTVVDAVGCRNDTIATVLKDSLLPFTQKIGTVSPTCANISSGSITATISGSQGPYSYTINGINYNSGITAGGLTYGNYQVVLLNNNGCVLDTINTKLNLTITPGCYNLFVPNAFTPNEDRLNDFLKPHAASGVINYSFSVYNRLGQLVFYTTDKTKGWDGRFNGVMQPSQGYIWVISYSLFDNPNKKELKKGTAVLIR